MTTINIFVSQTNHQSTQLKNHGVVHKFRVFAEIMQLRIPERFKSFPGFFVAEGACVSFVTRLITT